MLFLWFHSTVRLPGNEIGSILGKLKSEVNLQNDFLFLSSQCYIFKLVRGTLA